MHKTKPINGSYNKGEQKVRIKLMYRCDTLGSPNLIKFIRITGLQLILLGK